MNFPPDTLLLTFIEQEIFTRCNHEGKPLPASRKLQYRRLVSVLRLMLRRQPVLGDLTLSALAEFKAVLRLEYAAATVRDYAAAFLATSQLAGIDTNRRRTGKRARPLSDAEGTLWHLCQSRYFPVSFQIRAPQTRSHYRTAICDLKEAVGHDPTLADLDDEAFGRMMTMLAARGLSAQTVNERRNKLRALWEWAARKRLVHEFPTIQRARVPRRIPRAWTMEQLQRLMASSREERGFIAKNLSPGDFWTALGLLQWDTSERVGALLACQWKWLDDGGNLLIPAEARKGQDADQLYPLSGNTLGVLARLKPAGYDRILPWPFSPATFYNRYTGILERAGLPTDRKSKTHRMRKSVASHLAARGVDATMALGHSSPQVTRDSYLDPSIVGKPAICDVLPAIGDAPGLPGAEPKRLAFAGGKDGAK